jgi:hypothetical protein
LDLLVSHPKYRNDNTGRPAYDTVQHFTTLAKFVSQQGKAIYGHRMLVVEPVFGNIGSMMRVYEIARNSPEAADKWSL